MNIDSAKRKVSRHESNECSQQSIVSAMDRFVMAVNNMEDTVMVPSRLMDMSLDHKPAHNNSDVPLEGPIATTTDLLSCYNMLNGVKNELIWGLGDGKRPATIQEMDSRLQNVCPLGTNSPLLRRNEKLKQVESDSEVESSSESDSGLDSVIVEGPAEDPAVKLAKNFRRHLSGLFHSLQQLTDLSEFLTTRYQHEVGSSM